MKILIPGGAGFVGMNLTNALLKEFPDVHITVLDDFSTPSSRFNLEEIHKRKLHLVVGSYGKVALADDYDFIIDLAAHPSVRTEVSLSSGEAYADYLKKHLGGPLHSIFSQSHLKGYIFTSTSRIYPMAPLNAIPLEKGNQTFTTKHPPISESFPLEGQRSWYGMTKLQTELLIDELAKIRKFSVMINRCSLLTGPWQRGREEQGVYSFWLYRHYFSDLLKVSTLKYFGFGGEGYQVRDILDARDYARLLCLQVKSILEQTFEQTEVFNVGGGVDHAWSLAQHTELCQKLTSKKVNIEAQTETHPYDIPYYVTSIEKVSKRFQWKPEISLKQIFQDVLSWAQTRPTHEFIK